MADPVPAFAIDAFQQGRRRLMFTTAGGTVPVMTKTGVVETPYKPGEIILVDDADTIIVGPVSLVGAVDLAERILDGDQRMATDPKALLVLASAVVGFQIEVDPVPPQIPEPALAVAL